MPHNIPSADVEKHTKPISTTTRSQVAELQNHIQEVLENHHTFLQGSYKNDTSISDINDVDIVAIRTTTFSSVHTGRSYSTSIPWETIFSEIETKLKGQTRYSWVVKRRDKCIEVITSTLKADVVPAVQIHDDVTSDPIAIYSFKTGLEKANQPRTHYENGVIKNAATNNQYKPVVRMFKNWVVNHFGEDAPLSSYQIESLVHSAPNDYFKNDLAESFLLVSSHILNSLNQNSSVISVCGNEDITANWDITKRKLFMSTLGKSFLSVQEALKATTVADAQKYWNNAFHL